MELDRFIDGFFVVFMCVVGFWLIVGSLAAVAAIIVALTGAW